MRIARAFEFLPESREAMEFSGTEIGIDSARCVLSLRRPPFSPRPTVPVFAWARGEWGPSVRDVVQWIAVDVEVRFRTRDGVSRESDEAEVGFQIADGDGGRWAWDEDGAAWIAVDDPMDASLYVDLPTINAHLSELRVLRAPGGETIVPEAIALVYGLQTDDVREVVPEVVRASVLYEVESEHNDPVESALFDGLIPYLGEAQGTADLFVEWGDDPSSYDLHAANDEEPLEIVDVVLVVDPATGRTFEFGFDEETLILSLEGEGSSPPSIPSGTEIAIRVRFRPLVAVHTHPDYDELSRVPAVVVDAWREELKGQPLPSAGEAFRTGREPDGTENSAAALLAVPPRTVDLRLDLRIIASRVEELLRLAGEVERLIQRSPVVQCPSTGLSFGLSILTPSDGNPRAESGTLPEVAIGIAARSVQKWIFEPRAVHTVERINVRATPVPGD